MLLPSMVIWRFPPTIVMSWGKDLPFNEVILLEQHNDEIMGRLLRVVLLW